jgi:hypothetical protein
MVRQTVLGGSGAVLERKCRVGEPKLSSSLNWEVTLDWTQGRNGRVKFSAGKKREIKCRQAIDPKDLFYGGFSFFFYFSACRMQCR